MKITALLIAVLALLTAIVPLYTTCEHAGKAMALANGMQAPMKCFWTARGELALAIPLLGLAGFLALAKGQETRRALAILSAILGVLIIALPSSLIGVCQHSQAPCNLIMKPCLMLIGTLTAGAGLAGLALSERQQKRLARLARE